MSLNHSPSVATSGLVLALDAANRKSYIGAVSTSLINTNSWTVSSGSATGYNQNGLTAENARLYDTDPWGNQSIVWGTYASGDNGADGGWNTDYPAIDPTKLYRFSVWVRRTSSTSAGTFYFGTGAGGGEVRRTDNSATAGNPYWECQNAGVLTQNQWYLCCGHIYPHNTTYTGRHPNTGYFTIAGGTTMVMGVNGCNIGQDLKWDPASTSVVHRTYHFYCGDATTRLQFAFPRIDLCNGNEPSIAELLSNGNSVWRDLSGNNNLGVLTNGPAYSSGYITFDGVDDYVTVPSASLLNLGTTFTIEAFVKLGNLTNLYQPIFSALDVAGGLQTKGYSFHWYRDAVYGLNAKSLYLQFGLNSWGWQVFGSGTNSINDTGWHHVAVTTSGMNTGSPTITFYIDGVASSSTRWNAGSAGAILYSSNVASLRAGSIYYPTAYDGPYYLTGSQSSLKVYNRALSAGEVLQNFNALRGRFGI